MGLKILHANSNVLMQKGFDAIVNGISKDYEVSHCYQEKALFNQLISSKFDLVVLDYQSSVDFSTQTVIKISQNFPNQKVLIISAIGEIQDVLKVLEHGMQGYLTYECDEDEISQAIVSVSKGDKFFCNKVLDIILKKHLYQNKEDETCLPTKLTNRENEITKLIAQGNTNKQIADQLFVSHHTIHSHRKNIMKKLGAKSASEITLYAITVGLIQPTYQE